MIKPRKLRILNVPRFWIVSTLLSSVVSPSLDNVCKGVACHNGGTYEFSDEYCVCRCSPGFVGLLCEIELSVSAWPSGPYALLMPPSGCPEPNDHGWSPGYVHFSMSSPLTIWRYSASVTSGGNFSSTVLSTDSGANLQGPYGKYSFRLNFCFKHNYRGMPRESKWPKGNYSIFGTSDGCPEGFTEEMYTYNLPDIRYSREDGYLPFIRINTTTNELTVKLCTRMGGSTDFTMEFGTFVVLKSPAANCDSGSHGYDVVAETLVFENSDGTSGESTLSGNNNNNNNNNISFCHFWNPNKYGKVPCSGGQYHCGRGQCIARSLLCDGIPDCTEGTDETDAACEQKCDVAEFHCGRGVCIPRSSVCDFQSDCIDGRDEFWSNCKLKCETGEFYCDDGYCIPGSFVCDGWPDCWDETDEEFSNCDFGTQECGSDEIRCERRTCLQASVCDDLKICVETHNVTRPEALCPVDDDSAIESFMENIFYCGFGECIPKVYVCNGVHDCWNGRDELDINCNQACYSHEFMCLEDGCVSREEVCHQISGCDTTAESESLQCLTELGVTDSAVEDFQISASSWRNRHMPQMVRPTLDSWCPTENDQHPYLQIDFYTTVIIEGLIIFNRGIISAHRGIENEFFETVIPVGCRSFLVSHAMFPDVFKPYKDQQFQIDSYLNYSQPHTFLFLRPFFARIIRVHPTSPVHQGDMCLRIEVLGCKGTGQLTVNCYGSPEIFWIKDPGLRPATSPMYVNPDVENITSVEDCQQICRRRYEDCSAVEVTTDMLCKVYTHGALARYENVNNVNSATPLYLQVCVSDVHTDYVLMEDSIYYYSVAAGEPGEKYSLGYPFSYPSDISLLWNISSADSRFVHITFVDISLNSNTGNLDADCDVIKVARVYVYASFDWRFNGRTPTLPIHQQSVLIKFQACTGYGYDNYRGRGFHLIYHVESIKTTLRGSIYTVPHQITTYSLLGMESEKQVWVAGVKLMAQLSFQYFNVPCTEDCTFTINDIAYCNNKRPRNPTRRMKITVVFECSGDLTRASPEGFSATLTYLTTDVYKVLLLEPNGVNYTNSLELIDTFFLCISGHTAPTSSVCDGVRDCPDGSDEIGCKTMTLAYVPMEVKETTLEGKQVCSETLKKCYVLLTLDGRQTWKEESDICQTSGYTLLVIHEREEMGYLRTWMKAVHLFERDFERREMFYVNIGLVRYRKGGELGQIWQDGTQVSFESWGPNQPADDDVNWCTEMVLGMISGEMFWRSKPCYTIKPEQTDHFFGTICEKGFNTVHEGTNNTEYIVIDNITNMHLPPIEAKLHHCPSGEWIYGLVVCDGVPDCADGSDERACETTSGGDCSEDEFQCTDGECILLAQVCDHNEDCNPDGNDEFCNFPPCQTGEFRCSNEQCIPLSNRCDSVMDCLDNSDEIECVTCNTNTSFFCADQTCIHKSKVCDKYTNCIDGRDESNCSQPFSTCYDRWRSGYMGNATIEADGEDTVECVFHSESADILRVVTTIEIDTTWRFSEVYGEYITVTTGQLRNHGKTCQQEIIQSCMESERRLAMYFDPHMNDTFSHCVSTTTSVTITFSDSCENISYTGPTINGYEPFIVFPTCHGYDILTTALTRVGRNISVGFIKCETEYRITETQIGCEDGTVGAIYHKCLYHKGRAGNIEGCRNFKHLENCHTFECPTEYLKCPDSFCLARSLLCDGERQCPGGEDEANCWCESRNSSLAIVYYGVANEDVRPYIIRFARHFYSPRSPLKTISYTAYGQTPTPIYYKLTGRNVHPFSEVLNTAPEETREADNETMLREVVSMFGNNSILDIILIEDSIDSTRLLSAVSQNVHNITRLYRVRVDKQMKLYVQRFDREEDRETDVVLDRWDRLASNGAALFPEICKDDSSRNCSSQYRCSSSRVCIPLNQVCDGNSQCPFRDDEEMCDFGCHDKCFCRLYIVDCNNANITNEEVQTIPHTARKVDISNNKVSPSGVFAIPKTFSYLVRLVASNCDIRFIADNTFTKTAHLIYLDLSYNQISHIKNTTFVGLGLLRQLLLKGNTEIEIIEPNSFRSLRSLTRLSITKTMVSEVMPNTFAGLDIEELDISKNRISRVHAFAFNNLTALDIKLDGNDIKYFDSDIFAGIGVVRKLQTPAFKFCCYKPSSLPEYNCHPHRDEFSSCEDLMRNSALQTLLWIVCIAALVGNSCSIGYRVLYDRARLKTGFGMFVGNLALSDFLMGVYMMIIGIADVSFRKRYVTREDYWRNSGWCTLVGILASVSSEASMLFLCLITLDRILVIKFPFGQFRFSTSKASWAVLSCWLFSWFVAVLPALQTTYFQGSFYSTTGVCLALPLSRRRPPGWLYSFILFVGLNFVTFIMIAIGQLLIYIEIRKSSKRMKRMSTTRRKDLTVARNLLLVLTTDFLCWFPVGLMGILALEGYEIPGEVFAWTAVLILPINSALNPFLYTLSAIINRKVYKNDRRREKIGLRGFVNSVSPDKLSRLQRGVSSEYTLFDARQRNNTLSSTSAESVDPDVPLCFQMPTDCFLATPTFTPRIDEQTRSKRGESTKMLKFWRSGIIVRLMPTDHMILADTLSSGVTLATRDILDISLTAIRCIYHLHEFDHVIGVLDNKCICMPKKKRKVVVQGHPKKANNNRNPKVGDIKEFGTFVRLLLTSAKKP